MVGNSAGSPEVGLVRVATSCIWTFTSMPQEPAQKHALSCFFRLFPAFSGQSGLAALSLMFRSKANGRSCQSANHVDKWLYELKWQVGRPLAGAKDMPGTAWCIYKRLLIMLLWLGS